MCNCLISKWCMWKHTAEMNQEWAWKQDQEMMQARHRPHEHVCCPLEATTLNNSWSKQGILRGSIIFQLNFGKQIIPRDTKQVCLPDKSFQPGFLFTSYSLFSTAQFSLDNNTVDLSSLTLNKWLTLMCPQGPMKAAVIQPPSHCSSALLWEPSPHQTCFIHISPPNHCSLSALLLNRSQ